VRIQGVYASGITPEEVDDMASRLPKSLVNLTPVLKMTIGGRSCTEVDGFVQLLYQKVLDPRLMTKLLRFQAAMLVRLAFTRQLADFRFESGHSENSLHKNLPLDISLLALLVEGAIYADEADALAEQGDSYVRRAIRGQNLDRAGLAARHMKVLNSLSEPKSTNELAEKLGWDTDEVRQVLSGFVLAELVEQRTQSVSGQFLVFEPDGHKAQAIRDSLEESDGRYVGKVVRDKQALQLVLKRHVPHTILFSGDDDDSSRLMKQLFATNNPKAVKVKRVAMISSDQDPQSIEWISRVGFYPNDTLAGRCTAERLFETLDRLHGDQEAENADASEEQDRSIERVVVNPVPVDSDLNSIETVTAGVES